MLREFYYAQIKCTTEKDTNVVTQPNLSRTIRQILEDTALGKPSPVPLECNPHDSEVYKGKSLHDLHVCEDKFDAINRQRKYIKDVENKVTKNKKCLKDAENTYKNTIIEQAEKRGYEQAVRSKAQE